MSLMLIFRVFQFNQTYMTVPYHEHFLTYNKKSMRSYLDNPTELVSYYKMVA